MLLIVVMELLRETTDLGLVNSVNRKLNAQQRLVLGQCVTVKILKILTTSLMNWAVEYGITLL